MTVSTSLANALDDDVMIIPEVDHSQYYVPDGVYPGTITSAQREVLPSKFSNREWVVARLGINVQTENGDIPKRYDITLSWAPSSKWMKFLAEFGCEVTPGTPFRFSSVVGLRVTVQIKNIDKNGSSFSNVVSVNKRNEAAIVKPVKRAMPRLPKSGMAELFEEEGEQS